MQLLRKVFSRKTRSNPPAKSPFYCKRNFPDPPTDKQTHKQGVELFTGAIWWISPDTVKIEVGYYAGPLAGSGNIYTLKKKHGRWIVVKDDIVFLS